MAKLAKKQLAVAIPASVIADTPHLREKTAKIGLIGRAAAIFRVEEIIVYLDDPKADQTRDMELIELLLSYMETPQYLRKRLFPLSHDLQYAGILPPLRTAHHPLTGSIRSLKVGEYREGIVVAKEKNGALIEIGSEKPAFLPQSQVTLGERLTVKVTKIAYRVQVEAAERSEIGKYWGYTVSRVQSLGKLLQTPDFDLTLGTSKLAPPFRDVEKKLDSNWKKANSILILFGAPSRGLHEIAKDEDLNLNELVDFVVNTVPKQGTETVRTEEALLATLAILNLQFDP
jgi:methyltransferase